jgi:hypothetical protein
MNLKINGIKMKKITGKIDKLIEAYKVMHPNETILLRRIEEIRCNTLEVPLPKECRAYDELIDTVINDYCFDEKYNKTFEFDFDYEGRAMKFYLEVEIKNTDLDGDFLVNISHDLMDVKNNFDYGYYFSDNLEKYLYKALYARFDNNKSIN